MLAARSLETKKNEVKMLLLEIKSIFPINLLIILS